MREVLGLVVLVLGATAQGAEPGDKVPWVQYPVQKAFADKRCGPVLTDIERHIAPRHGTYYRCGGSDPVTWGHETTHGINGDLTNRNVVFGPDGRHIHEWFYCLEGRAIGFSNPRFGIAEARALVPGELHGQLWSYLTSANTYRYYARRPLYLVDEWVAYVNGAEVWHDQRKYNPGFNRNGDGVFGVESFVPYMLALCLAIEQHDPDYLRREPAFQEFMAFNLRRSQRVLGKQPVAAAKAGALRGVVVRWYGEAFASKYVFAE